MPYFTTKQLGLFSSYQLNKKEEEKIEESFKYGVRIMYLMDNENPSYAKIGEFLNNLFVKFHHKIYSLLVSP